MIIAVGVASFLIGAGVGGIAVFAALIRPLRRVQKVLSIVRRVW